MKNTLLLALLFLTGLGTAVFAAPEQTATREEAAQQTVQKFFTALMKVDDVKGMKETVSFPFSSVFVSHTQSYPLQIDNNEAEFEKRFSQLMESLEGQPKKLEEAKKQLGATTFSQFKTTLQGDTAYVTCMCQVNGPEHGDKRLQKLMSVLQQTKDEWKMVFTTLPT